MSDSYFYKEDYNGVYCRASCLVSHDNHRKYDTIEYFYPIFRCYENADIAFNMGKAQILKVPYEKAKKILNV